MKKPTFSKTVLIVSFVLLGLQSFAQNYVPFTPRYNEDIKGDIVLIGNNILGPNNDAFNDVTMFNHLVDMQYIDIDSDPSTFSSSSADLEIANPNCYQIKHAGLYWGAVTAGDASITNVKFKGPEGDYYDIVGDIIFDADGTSVDGGNSFSYACYADVTSIVTGLTNDLGTYTVANVSSATGRTASFNPYNGTGYSAGWSLFIVYEDPTLPGKSITSFDGFSAISVAGANPTLDIPITGFRTVPAPTPVRANFAFATLEGDAPIQGDRLRLNGVTLSTADRPANNFFNSTVTQLSALPVNNRNPNSANTLGFDTGVMVVPNPGNTVIANDATSATVRLETSQDTYFQYFFAFAVEIIEPNIVLTKIVEDDLGNDIGGQTVGLSQPLNYVIGFQNTGNDNATNFQIRDILPINIIFNYPEDLVLPPGVTVSSYDSATRELVFDIEDYLVEENDPAYEIRIEVMTVETCNQLADACSNIINNQAYATYNGFFNPNFTVTDDPSFSINTGCLITPQATNFLADLDDCIFQEDIILCGATVELTAANGYDAYSWSTSPTGTPVIGTTQTITVSSTGIYYVQNTATAPCQSIEQQFNVTLFGGDISNPVIPFADEVVICPNDGKLLPLILLCGENDSTEIQTNISGVSSIIWEQLNESSCDAVSNQDCANESTNCSWNQLGTGPNFNANSAGQFRLTINYSGGCFNRFYFNVYQNLLNPNVTATDIVCNTPSSITVGGVPSGYEYSLDGINYQPSNIFSVTSPGIYSVNIRQIGVDTNPCIFSVPDVQIRERNFTVSTVVEQPLCNGDLGSIYLAANDVDPQYFFSLYQGATLVNSVGPIAENTYIFANLNPGTYTANIETEDGCTHSEDIEIIEPPLLTATAALTIPLTCTDGEITVYPEGGTAPYFYFVNGSSDFQTVPEIEVTAPGVFNILVIDSNNCEANTTITVEAIPQPEFDVSFTDILCMDPNSGTISVNVSNANGNTLQYSIDSGSTFSGSSVFTGLSAGDYEVVAQYSFASSVCLSDPQTIIISADDPIIGTATLTAPYTCDSDGTITVTDVSGGSTPYTYSIDGVNFQTGNTFTGLANGTYTITVQDSSGCAENINTITIEALNPPTDLTFSSSALSCPSNTSTVTITGTSGGVAPLEYQIIAPASAATVYQTSNEFADLAPGTYTFQVRDANDCTYSESFTITALDPIIVVGQILNDVSCFGADDGSAQFTVSATTNFSYTFNGGTATAGTSPVILSGLVAGTYTIVVTDNTTNCDGTATVTVNQAAVDLSITTNVNPITCLQNGSVVINASGGWGGNVFSLTLPDGTVLPNQSNNNFTNLTQDGTYTVTVTDSNGCIATDTFDLNTPNSPVASIDTTSDFCYDTTNGASIEVTVTSGEAPFEYSLNGGAFQSSNIFNNLTPGAYTVTVRDAFGCVVTLSEQTIAPQLSVSTVLTDDLDCTASPDALISGTIVGGYAPFNYAVSVNGGAITALGTTGPNFTYSTGTAGTYRFEITDAQGCIIQTGTTTINPITPPAISTVLQTQDILCNGDSNAAIQVSIDTSSGTAPFVINVNNDTTGVNYGTQTSGLPAGTYTVTVTDARSCTATETITISEPDDIVVDYFTIPITCTTGGISQGSIIINSVNGGTAPYNYFVTGTNGYSNSEMNATGSTSVSFDVVDFGLYQINVVDANGCSVLFQDVLVASPPDDLEITINTSVDCLTGGEAVVSVSSTLASSGPFFFSIYQGPISVYPNPAGSWIPEDSPGSQSATFTGLTPSVLYTFIVYDESTLCSYYEPATTPIPTNSTLTASTVSANNITCTGSADGNVTFTVNSVYGTATNISYEIFDSLSQNTTGISGTGVVPASGSVTVTDLGPLPFGNYYVLISETSGPNTGCSVVTVAFNITESAIPLNLSVSVDQNANCNAASGVISAIGQDGTAPYRYQVTTTAAAPLASDPLWASASSFNLDAGNYYVHVLDAYGCIVTSSEVILPSNPSPAISATVTNDCTAVEGAFEIDVTLASAGVAPYSYRINGSAFQTQTLPFTIFNLNSGSYTIEVRDVNGCSDVVTVDIEAPIGLTPAITALPSCTDDDGAITMTGIGGTGNYVYTISPNPTSITLSGNVFSGVPSGTYTITMTDTVTLCTEDVSVTLQNATPVIFTTTVDEVSCHGGSDGMITVNLPPSNNNPVYTYEIIAPISIAAQTSNVFTGLATGTYTVQVTSGRNCVATEDVTIGEPSLLDVSGTATDFACAIDNSVNTSTLTITEVGGTAPYLYSINGINYFSTNTFNIIDNGSIQNITVYVQDANGCIATNSVIVNPLEELTSAIAAIATPIDCNSTGTVEIMVTGGSGNFTYEMLPSGTPQASNIFDISSPGDYYFQVNDIGTGCFISTAPITIAPFNLIDVTATASTDITCFGDTNGAIQINVSDYNGNYTYQVFDGLGTAVTGVIAANTTANPQEITGLSAGNFTVEVNATDSPFCTATSNVVTIVSPPTPLTLTLTETANVTCDNNSGTITAIANGGFGGYEYELTGTASVAYSPNGSFTGLSAGNYVVNARDAGGCIVSENIVLIEPAPITTTFTPNITLLSCFGDQNASITVSNVTGGQGNNYSYTLNTILPTSSSSGPQSSPVFNNLAAGTYIVTVTDALNCDFTSLEIVISQPTPINANLVVASTQTCETETTLTLSANGGTGSYEYSTSSNYASVLGTFVSSVTFPVSEGTYAYYVRDANGCEANISNEITIDPLPELILTLTSTNPNINCFGDNNGSITATAQGGLGNYVYTLEDNMGNTIPATQNSPGVFTELVAGDYVVIVESGDCDVVSQLVSISQPTAPLEATFNVNDVTCFGGNDGFIEIIATGGTGNIQYAISPQSNQFFDTNRFENLAPGDYDVIVQDVLGCFLIFNFTITEPEPVIISIVADSIFPEVCEGDADGEFSIEISGGTAPYSVSLDDYDGPYTVGAAGQTQFDFTDLGGGDHVVFVRDSEGCESEWNITFPESVSFNPMLLIESVCVNDATENVVTVNVEGDIDPADLDYALNGGAYQMSNVFTNVPVGTDHYIEVRHTNGCIQTTEFFNVEQYEPLVIALNEGNLNEIIAVTAGGTGDYQYTLNGVDYGDTSTFTITETGNYTVVVTDNSGCSASATIFREFVDICIPNYFTPNGDGVNDGWAPGCVQNYPNLEFDIFDRYGRKVGTYRVGQYWDGRYNNKELPTGDYWYVVRLNSSTNDRDFVGHFTLYR
ncbi:T9SS type B sorting domain-containing protein [Paucihalobacter sp.]|uniref:T9SS type B sorting domain-containing protein n=1 Tax=Paucihalobacter sp. TaxID=2850405 RepID=UPI003D160719